MVTLTEKQWKEIQSLISDAIEFGEAMTGNDDSVMLDSLREREQNLLKSRPKADRDDE